MERMFVVQISLCIVTFLSLTSQNLSMMQTTKEVNLQPRIAPHVNMWSVFFFFFCHLLNVGACICHITGKAKWSGPHHNIKMLHFVSFHSVTCYTNFKISCMHVNTTKLRNITCIPVATDVILRSLFHSVTFCTNFKISRMHVNTTKLRNITCIPVATDVILRSLECNSLLPL